MPCTISAKLGWRFASSRPKNFPKPKSYWRLPWTFRKSGNSTPISSVCSAIRRFAWYRGRKRTIRQKCISARNSSASCLSMTRMTTAHFSSRWRSSRTIWSSRAEATTAPIHLRHCERSEAIHGAISVTRVDCFVAYAPRNDGTYDASLPLRPMQLHRQSFHRIGHLAPSRQPASWKTKGQIGTVDAALAQAHSRRRAIARAAGVEVRRVGQEQVFVAVGRTVAKCAPRQPVLPGHRGLFEISGIDGSHPGIRCQRVMVRRYRQKNPVDRLHRFFDRIGADMPGWLGRLERRKGEGEIDALLRPGVALDLHADRHGWHVKERRSDTYRQPRRTARSVRSPGRPQQIGDQSHRARCDRASQRDRDHVVAGTLARTVYDVPGRRKQCHERSIVRGVQGAGRITCKYAMRRRIPARFRAGGCLRKPRFASPPLTLP